MDEKISAHKSSGDIDAEDLLEAEPSDVEDEEEEIERNIDVPDSKNDIGAMEEIEDRVKDKRKTEYFAAEEELPEKEDDLLSFNQMNISRPLMKGLNDLGYVKPTRIQSMTVPVALMGKDICGAASTGSGKTAAFLIPILERLLYRPKNIAAIRVLILTPTRELAAQCHSVAVSLAKYTDIVFSLCVGGMSNQQQEQELRKRPDVLIATPGRLIDHVNNSANFSLDQIEILILDEADRMLEEGFQAEMQEIIKSCPRGRQTLLFSATMTDDVDQMIRLSLNKPVRLFLDPRKSVASNLVQEFIRVRIPAKADAVEAKKRTEDLHISMDPVECSVRESILVALCQRTYKTRTIVFFPSKSLCHKMKIVFGLLGMKAAELHGNLTQLQRLESLEAFRDGKVDFLLATDLAARGLDIAGVETVINFQMPAQYERYVHRVGRTARADRSGKAVTLIGEQERKMLKMVVKNLRPGQELKQRTIPASVLKKYSQKIKELEPRIASIKVEEKQEKALRQAEMELTKAENVMKHSDEIYSRPAKKWFQTEKDKVEDKKKAKQEIINEAIAGIDDDAFKKDIANMIEQSKRKSPMAGLSRKQKRRKMAEKELGGKEGIEREMKKQKLAAKHAKRAKK